MKRVKQILKVLKTLEADLKSDNHRLNAALRYLESVLKEIEAKNANSNS